MNHLCQIMKDFPSAEITLYRVEGDRYFFQVVLPTPPPWKHDPSIKTTEFLDIFPESDNFEDHVRIMHIFMRKELLPAPTLVPTQ